MVSLKPPFHEDLCGQASQFQVERPCFYLLCYNRLFSVTGLHCKSPYQSLEATPQTFARHGSLHVHRVGVQVGDVDIVVVIVVVVVVVVAVVVVTVGVAHNIHRSVDQR